MDLAIRFSAVNTPSAIKILPTLRPVITFGYEEKPTTTSTYRAIFRLDNTRDIGIEIWKLTRVTKIRAFSKKKVHFSTTIPGETTRKL